MERSRSISVSIIFVVLLGLAFGGNTAAGQLSRDGRWFRNEGRHVYLVGVDMQSLVNSKPRPGYDGNYKRILDILSKSHINKVRIWANCWFLDPEASWQPYSYHKGKYDLDSWNPDYWSRLRDFVSEAKSRGIFIEYCIFSQYPNKMWESPTNFWNRENNINGVFVSKGNDSAIPEFYINFGGQKSFSDRDMNAYQEILIRKAIMEIGAYGNVYFQVHNEPHDVPQVYPWTRKTADLIRSLGQMPSVEVQPEVWTKGEGLSKLNEYWDHSSIDIMGNHTYLDDPKLISDKLHASQSKGKVLQCSESFDVRKDLDKSLREAWGWALSGGHYAFFIRDMDFDTLGDGRWMEIGRAAATLRNVMEQAPFWEMSPVDDSGNEYDLLGISGPPGSSWQILCRPGVYYVVYLWDAAEGGSFKIKLPEKDYMYRFVDVRNGREAASGEVAGKDETTIPFPEPLSWDPALGLALLIDGR